MILQDKGTEGERKLLCHHFTDQALTQLSFISFFLSLSPSLSHLKYLEHIPNQLHITVEFLPGCQNWIAYYKPKGCYRIRTSNDQIFQPNGAIHHFAKSSC